MIHTHHPSMICTAQLHKVYPSSEDSAAAPLEQKNNPCPLEQLPGPVHQPFSCKTMLIDSYISILPLLSYHELESMVTNKNITAIFIYCQNENNKLVQFQEDNKCLKALKILIPKKNFTKEYSIQIVNRHMKMSSTSQRNAN